MNRIVIFLIILCIFGLSFKYTKALNISLPYSLSSELAVELVPEYPRPNERVWVEINLYTDDLNSAKIGWYVNNKLESEGVGLKTFSFMMKGVGETMNLSIKVELASGVSFTRTISLTPASVDILWEAQSYTPPFYKGKALHSPQGLLKLVAMPEFYKDNKYIDPKNLVYTWSNDAGVLEKQSGYGKNIVIANGSLLGDIENINLLVTDPTNNLVAKNSITISPQNPKIVFYQNDPFYGFSIDKAVYNIFDLKKDELQLIASPYFFTIEGGNINKYKWTLNNIDMDSLDNLRTVLFKKTEGGGSSIISLRSENSNRVLQFAESSVVIKFDK